MFSPNVKVYPDVDKVMIKILIVDDNHLFRKRLKVFLIEQPEIEVVGEALNSQEALRKAGELEPDVVLMDIKMKHTNGFKITRKLKEELPWIKVIILSSYDLNEYREAAQASGASAYVTKRALVDELLPTVRRVLQHDQST